VAQQEQDRSEEATPYKREQARKRGAIAKSVDVVAFAVLSTALLYWTLAGPGFGRRGAELAQRLFAGSGGMPLDEAAAVRLLRLLLSALAADLLPVLAVVAAVAALATLLQVGAVVSFQPLKPDLQRLNPIEGFKRMFSVRMLIEAAKTLVKAALLVAVLVAAVWAALPRLFFGGAGMTPAYWSNVGAQVVWLGWTLVGALLLVALADWVLVRWELARRLRMSRREVREELRHREGDPRIKQRQRQLRLEALKRARGLGRVPDADVLVTNPTHLAVALKYDREKGETPEVIAKGAGELASAMRLAARRHGVPVFQNVKLARSLFRLTPIDAGVPAALFPEVARVLVWAYRLRDAKGRAA
jgi:flagellar biosynthetic protein FlhB